MLSLSLSGYRKMYMYEIAQSFQTEYIEKFSNFIIDLRFPANSENFVMRLNLILLFMMGWVVVSTKAAQIPCPADFLIW